MCFLNQQQPPGTTTTAALSFAGLTAVLECRGEWRRGEGGEAAAANCNQQHSQVRIYIYFNLCNVVCVPRVEMVYIHTPLQKSSGPIPITSFHILGPVSIAPFPIHVVFLWSFCLKWN